MHVTNTALFLVVFVLIAAMPILFAAAALVRRRREARRDEPGARSGPVTALVVALAAVTAVGGVAVWIARSSPSDASDMPGMDMGGTGARADVGAGTQASLPGMLGGLPMVDSVSGPAALDQIAGLHGSSFAVVDAAIATYLDGSETSTVWVAWVADGATAQAMTREMAEGIDRGGSPFDPPWRWAKDRSVWVTDGMGQRHFFFARGNVVWWLAADADVASTVLEDLLWETAP